MISIIIPTLNEEKYLPKLLESIKKQSYKDYEVIVADGGSKDKTKKIARKYGCKLVQGGSPAKGRNHGAEHAKGDYLLFLDADVTFSKTFLETLIEQQKKKQFDFASVYLLPEGKNFFDHFFSFFMNIYFFFLQKIWPHASGMCIFSRRKLHNEIKGYNEKIVHAEDHEYITRASKKGKFSYLFKPVLKFSVRRLDKEGRLTLVGKYIYSEIYRFFKKEIKKDIFKYEFGKHE